MPWRDVIKRAWVETLLHLGVSDFSLFRLLLWAAVSAAFVCLIWIARGGPEAMTEAWDIALYCLAFIGVAFLPVFVWSLWLAPYGLLKEEIDRLPKAVGPTLRGSLSTGFNLSDWEGVRVFQLGDAACLWVGVEPHSPISHPKALAMFKRLSGEVVGGRLQCNTGWAGLSNLFGGEPWWPKHPQTVSAISLRRYADGIGEVPPFLRSVVVPVEEESPKEAGGGSKTDPSGALVPTTREK